MRHPIGVAIVCSVGLLTLTVTAEQTASLATAIVFDMSGDGFRLTDKAHGVQFDLDDDGMNVDRILAGFRRLDGAPADAGGNQPLFDGTFIVKSNGVESRRILQEIAFSR